MYLLFLLSAHCQEKGDSGKEEEKYTVRMIRIPPFEIITLILSPGVIDGALDYGVGASFSFQEIATSSTLIRKLDSGC